MNKKYKELPPFGENPFKVDDLVQCVDSCTMQRQIHIVKRVIEGYVEINTQDFPKGIEVHFTTCRKLEEIQPREFYLHPILGTYIESTKERVDNFKLDNGFHIKVREVLE